MNALEWMPLFGDAFWESERVAAMDDSAVALYSWLLWRQFKHGDLPPLGVLRKIPSRWTGAAFDRLWPQVADCFDVLADGRLSNPRCHQEREGSLAMVERKRVSSARANRARWGKASPSGRSPTGVLLESDRTPTGGPSGQHPDSESDPPGIHPTGPDMTEQPPQSPPEAGGMGVRRGRVQWAGEIPEPLRSPEFEAAWIDWLEHRSSGGRGGALSQQSGDAALAELSAWGVAKAVRAIRHSIASSYQGIKPAPGEEPSAHRSSGMKRAPSCSRCSQEGVSLMNSSDGQVCMTCWRSAG